MGIFQLYGNGKDFTMINEFNNTRLFEYFIQER